MKKALIAVFIIIVISAIGLFVVIRKITSEPSFKEEETSKAEPTIVLPTISDNIKIALTTKNDNKTVVLKITGLNKEYNSIEYELTYNTGAGLPRGVIGKINLDGEKEIIRDDIVLGTCSSGKCVYDAGVTEINLVLKFNSEQGSSIYQQKYNI